MAERWSYCLIWMFAIVDVDGMAVLVTVAADGMLLPGGE